MLNNRKKEYGGYLPIEQFLKKSDQNFFFNYKSKNITKLNCGRTCFYVAAKSIEIRKIYIPYFTCLETPQPFKDLGIPVSFYELDCDLMPKNINLGKKEYLLWTNYYGNASAEMISLIEKKYRGRMIVDNCHAFYCLPLEHALNCYSARKFFGVADGAYLISDNEVGINVEGLKIDHTKPYMEHLYKQIKEGTNKGYDLNLVNEKRLEKNYSLMSKTSDEILNKVDYQKIKNIRVKNFSTIHSYLNELNDFPVNEGIGTQMYYPFKCKDLFLREKLLKEKVYSPTWWRHVSDILDSKSIEVEYTMETVLLPVDQRYSTYDMKVLSDLIMRLVEI